MTDNRTINIYKDIVELSDVKLQKKRWLSGDSEEISSYEELMCSFFDDNNIIEFIENELEKYSSSNQLRESLQKLVTALNDFDDKGFNDSEIIDNKNWQEITSIADRTKNLWNRDIDSV